MNSLSPSNPSLLHLPDPVGLLAKVRAEIRKREADAERDRIAHDAERIRDRCKTLAGFVREAWHVLEPTAAYLHGWHIDAICSHLEAITDGRITRLLINVPPGTMKSLIVSVFWPAWEWGPRGLPGMRYLTTSYKEDFVKRDSRRMRDLVSSEWFRALWPEITLARSGEISFANTRTGNREGVAFAGLTAGRGDRVIIDDPHSTETAESPTERDKTTRIFRESVPTRLNDPLRSAIVVVMQRLHENDVSGQILKLGLGYVHLMLPMEFEPERRCRTPIGFEDPRSSDGDLLFPERFPRAVVERDKVPMGPYAVAGQFQQRPAPREGGLFKRDWFGMVRAAPAGCTWVRAWDLAASEQRPGSEPAYTAGVKMGRASDGRFYIAHVTRDRRSPGGVEQMIVNTAQQDRQECRISLPQDPGQAGKAQAQYLVRQLVGFKARATPETGDKVTRAEPVSAQAEAGNILLVQGDWNDAFLDEVTNFPNGAFKDQVDAMSRAFDELASARAPLVIPEAVVNRSAMMGRRF